MLLGDLALSGQGWTSEAQSGGLSCSAKLLERQAATMAVSPPLIVREFLVVRPTNVQFPPTGPLSTSYLRHRQAHLHCDRPSASTQVSCLGGLGSEFGGRLARDSCSLFNMRVCESGRMGERLELKCVRLESLVFDFCKTPRGRLLSAHPHPVMSFCRQSPVDSCFWQASFVRCIS